MKYSFFVFLCWPLFISSDPLPLFTIHNVGQGQWISYSGITQCLHFDLGGEALDFTPLQDHCSTKDNIVFISHEDWDHISGLHKAQKQLRSFCIATTSKRFQTWRCRQPVHTERPLHILMPCKRQKSRNADSKIFLFDDKFVIPGDSTKKQEKAWVHKVIQLKPPQQLTHLILGHHGSNTSTGAHLLETLHGLTQTFGSSRHGKYGHPHPAVIKRLQDRNLAPLLTEKWGTVSLILKRRPTQKHRVHHQCF